MELIAVLLLVYLLPGFIASGRTHHNALAIWALTILAGWTAVGWLVAFVWACTAVRRPAYTPQNEDDEEEMLLLNPDGTARRRFPGWVETKMAEREALKLR